MKKGLIFIMILLLVGGVSCKKDFLKETPVDFLSSTNAFQTAADFDASVNNLYRLLRLELFTRNENDPWTYIYRTDLGVQVTSGFPPNLAGEYNPIGSFANRNWSEWYKIVAET